jgi:Heavy metal binding domain
MDSDVPARIRYRTHRRAFLGALAGAAAAGSPLLAQEGRTPAPAQDLVYQCIMHPEVRQSTPGKCPICHMPLQTNIPEAIEYPMDFSISPKPPKAGVKEVLTFTLYDPRTGKQIKKFVEEHEKLFHLFIVGADLDPTHFVHDHPVFGPDKKFRYTYKFAKPGRYGLLGDCLPDGGTIQLSPKTVIVPGGTMQTPHLTKDYAQRQMTNMGVSITTVPEVPIAGSETRIFVHLTEADGLERYIGAWAHMLGASDDLIDLMHAHPYIADGSVADGKTEMRFDIYFPRARGYRTWFQFQKNGKVNTAYFDIPVLDVEAASRLP